MAIQGLGDNVKDRVEAVGQQTQDVMQAYFNTTRQFYNVVFDNAQTLAQAEYRAAKGWADATASHMNEVRSGGVEQIAFVPVKLWPLSREHLFGAYEVASEHFVKTRDELLDVIRQGYRSVWTTLSGDGAGRGLSVKAPGTAGQVSSVSTKGGTAPGTSTNPEADQQQARSKKSTRGGAGSAAASAKPARANDKPAARTKRKTATTARKTSSTAAQSPKASESSEGSQHG